MSESFNPYLEWLGVRSAADRPNFYELLRLEPFEANPEAILTAANVQMAKVRSQRSQDHPEHWRRLLAEIDVAKRVLCDPEEKAVYDDELRETGVPPVRSTGPSARRSPYMVVAAEGISNLLPPGLAKPKPKTTLAAGDVASDRSNPIGDGSAGNSPAASADSWIPAERSDRPWMPPSSRSAKPQEPLLSEPVNAGPSTPTSESVAPAPASQKRKLAFPGETVSIPSSVASADTASPSLPAGSTSSAIESNSASPSPVSPAPMPFPTFPGSAPQIAGGGIQLPKPIPLLPLPGMPAGAFPRPQMPQFAPTANPFAAATSSPQMPHPVALQPIRPQPAPTQSGPSQPAMHAAEAVESQSFIDDVLNTPKPSARSTIDEFAFDEPEPHAGAESHATPTDSETSDSSAETHFEPATDGAESDHAPDELQKNPRSLRIAAILAGTVVLCTVVGAAVLFKPRQEPAPSVMDSGTNGNRANDSKAADHSAPNSLATKSSSQLNSSPTNSNSVAGQPTAHSETSTAPPNQPRANSVADAHGPALSDTTPNKPPNSGSGPRPLVIQPTRPTSPFTKPATPAAPTVDPAQIARLNHLLVDARRKLAERNQVEAERLVAEAKSLASTPEQTDRVDRMATLVKYVGEFWGAVRDALAALKVADEIDVGTTKVVVVESDKQSLTIHLGSGNRHFTLRELPSGLAIALANRWLDPNKPANKVFIGSFCAVDPKLPDGPEIARRLWTEAAAAGISDGQYLLLLLNANATGSDANGDESLPPPPDAEAVARATAKIRTEFDAAIVAATTRNRIDELVRKFFDAADASDNPVRRYALCVQARDTAASAGRAQSVADAIDRIAREFRIDALAAKAETFAANPAKNEEAGREIARVALKLIDEAVAEKRLDVAGQLASIAVSSAEVSKGSQLLREANQRSKEIAALSGK